MNHSRPQTKKWRTTSAGESCFRCGKWLTKMHVILLAALLSSTFTTGECFGDTLKVDVPSLVDPRWEKVVLRCEYDLRGEELYSLKWFKNHMEFFRYMPAYTPICSAYPVEGIYVDLNNSDSKQVTLLGYSSQHRGEVNLTGDYSCEVSLEAPSFTTNLATASMTMAALPKEPPTLYGLRPSYEVGETLQVECSSAPSYPPSQLTYILNGMQVYKAFTKELPSEEGTEGNVLSSSRLGLSLPLKRYDFSGGTLSLVCQSTLPGIPGSRALKTVGTATLAASNQRLAQEPPKGSASSFNTSILSTIMFLILIAAQSCF